MSSFVRTQFEKKFKKVSYDDTQTYSSDDECSSEDDDDISSFSASCKQQFQGMRIFDNISPSVSNSYF